MLLGAKPVANSWKGGKQSMISSGPRCPICGHGETSTLHAVQERHLLICGACRHVFWREMPTDEKLGIYYNNEYTCTHNQLAIQKDHIDYYRGHVEELAALTGRPKQDLIFGDVGCSYPVFLIQAVAAGVSLALGVDLSPQAQHYGLQRGVPVLAPAEFIAEVPDGALDVLRYSHTLEHLIDPAATLEAHLAKLAPGGLLYVTQPCIPVLRFGRSPAPPHDAVWPNHLHFFSALSILTLMRRFGLEVERFFTVADETEALARYGDALDTDFARTALTSLVEKGEAVRGPLNNFPFFTGKNFAVYARRPSARSMPGARTASAGERAALSDNLQRQMTRAMVGLLAKPTTDAAASTSAQGF